MRYLLALIASAVAAYILSFVVTVAANPEIRFWRDVQLRRQAEIREVRNEAPSRPVILFTGGSSTAFSVDPLIIEEACNVPAFNLALPASAGPFYILRQALTQAQPGDTLVIGLEADFFAYESDYPASGLSFGLATLAGDVTDTYGGGNFSRKLTIPDAMNLARPGARFLLTLIYRGVSGKGYRYRPTDYRHHGRLETQVEDPGMQTHDVMEAHELSDSGRQMLVEFRAAAASRGVKLLYAMPVRWTSVETADAARERNGVLLRSIDPIVPVIDDGTLGVSIDRHHFSDSHQHLTAAGSEARSRALAPKLRELLSQD